MSRIRRGLTGAGPLLLILAACSPAASQPAGAADAAPATTLAWVGEDAARGLKVIVEPIAEPAEAGRAAVSLTAPLQRALAVGRGESILQVRVLGAAARSEPAALAWPDGSRLLPAQPREDASARERLLYEAVGAGAAHPWLPTMPDLRRDYLVVGPLSEAPDEALLWADASGPLELTLRRWTTAERLACLGTPHPVHAEAAHD